MSNKFESLSLDPRLIKNLNDLNFSSMTPIQEKSLPLILEGSDVIAQAKTGSGKTVAFGLGALNDIDIKQTRPQVLILCPTRELAEQVAKEMRMVARTIPNVKILTITGGKSEYHQSKSLSHGAHVIVGTPGRVLKLLRKKVLNLDFVNYYILDEADRMLDMGFSEDIFKISSFVPADRQTLLFSATFPQDIEELSSELQNDAIKVSVDVTHNESMIKEEFIELESHKDKMNALEAALANYQSERFIIFCKTKRICDDVADELYENGVVVSSIHSDLEQNERTAVLTMFSNRSLSGIVATDVAARGIDIKDLDLVVNFDLPNDPEVYVHRIGRTGRAGNEGHAVSFLTQNETDKIQRIEEYQNKEHELKGVEIFDSQKEYKVRPEMSSIYISGGKKDKLRPGDIVGAIVGESGIDFKDIGDISITNVMSYVAIKSEHVKLVCKKLNEGRIKNRRFRVGIL
ncbi:ATP-dependent RNA helicase DbpA [Bacteriovorax sp. DB6_IX]|uniref:ATP-dependent RNA helicase DbpA n=1 Tax=Bacteriovorax sp. DB6_IX TaxID=1353530 RepID=UPI00038A2A45|nr:ATP-dependent RNA helicase DbpA [Bacteriovorax sp. DB6_IX]EQC51796.1 DEAD/DEAH box helicase [Bacteriovorax sp. DB6_IX]